MIIADVKGTVRLEWLSSQSGGWKFNFRDAWRSVLNLSVLHYCLTNEQTIGNEDIYVKRELQVGQRTCSKYLLFTGTTTRKFVFNILMIIQLLEQNNSLNTSSYVSISKHY